MEFGYFAYGSNLSLDQMVKRTGERCQLKSSSGIVRLANHRLVFQRLDSDGPAYANIVSPGDGVLGVIYLCSQAALEKLDRFESGYERRPVEVVDQQGVALTAEAYFMKPAIAANIGRPSDEYLQRIVTGARQHGLPEEYIESLVASGRLVK